MSTYNHNEIEKKWQTYWEKNKTFSCEIDPKKPKYYVLDMFPYPSGSGLHVGHVVGYAATDIIARYKRMKGFNVLHPMGWDSFGLPAEQFAVRTGTHPAISTKKNIDTFRQQLKALGFSYDWDREIATSDSQYYKWTQWIFTKLYEKNLAYEAESLVNFCPHLGTVLANEEVENGVAKEGGYAVERIPLKQWVLKITEYADRLLEDLELLDWPENVKQAQKNWIGRSVGAIIRFKIENFDETISVFTTCQDTIFGVTFLVLSPEHPLVNKITTSQQKKSITEYQTYARTKSDLERTELNKEKTGVFTGAYALIPGSNKKIPIWIADYVLTNYGTGAVMAVPGHDERDFEFAKKFDLEIKCVIDPELALIEKLHPDINPREIHNKVHFNEIVWPHDGTMIHSHIEGFSLDGISNIEAKQKVNHWLKANGYGESTIHYKLRDWLFSRQRYWGEPIPILHFEDGSKRALGVDELPLCPPEINDYKPTGDGHSPLAKVRTWVEIVDPKTGKGALRETNTMPQWAGSCWYYLRFCDPKNQKEPWEQIKENYWMPVDLYIGGVEHAVLHLLYARFWHKVLYDIGVVSTKEPFQTLRNQGLVVARSYKNSRGQYIAPEEVYEEHGAYYHKETQELLVSQIDKMSKSKLNGVSPDDIIREYGADSLRMYEMFMGPLEKEKVWNNAAILACRRFLLRVYDMVYSSKVVTHETEEATRLIHRLIAKMEYDYEHLQFNTAIAKMMEFLNDFTRLDVYPKSVLERFIQVLSPFAPHITEELWSALGRADSLSFSKFPTYDPQYLEDPVVTYVIQVNGKVRARLDLPRDQEEDIIVHLAKDHPNVIRFLDGKPIQKTVFVKNKLLSIVV